MTLIDGTVDKHRFPKALILNGYGMSEAGGVSSCDHYGHMGGLMPGVALRVVDPEDPEGPALGPGAVGEFQLQTRAMMQGYINEKEEAFTKDGWFKSGDLGW